MTTEQRIAKLERELDSLLLQQTRLMTLVKAIHRECSLLGQAVEAHQKSFEAMQGQPPSAAVN